MKKFSGILCFLLAMLMVVGMFAACDKKPENETVADPTEGASATEPVVEENNYEKDKAEYDAMTAEQLVEKYVADPANLTIAEYADLLATYAFVEIEDGSFTYSNKSKDAIDICKDAGSKLPNASESELAKIMAAKPYANSRAYYYCLLASFVVPQDSEGYNALKEQYKKETDPFVIACVIRGLSRTFGYDAEFCKYALSFVDSDNYEARLRLAMALHEYNAVDKEEVVQAALTLLADKEGNIAYHAAEECGAIADDRFVEPIKALLADTDKVSVHSYAAKGLIRMWYNGKVSEAAYNATMEYLKAESTDSKYPAWSALSLLTTPEIGPYEEWRAEATYFNEKDLVDVMKGLVADAEAEKLIKTNAVKVIGAFGTADDLNELKSMVETSADKDAIIKEIDKQLEAK